MSDMTIPGGPRPLPAPGGQRSWLLPGIGFGVSVALMRFELWLPALVLFIVTTGVALVTDPAIRQSPRSLLNTGIIVRKTGGDSDVSWGHALSPLLAPGAALLVSGALESASVDPMITGPLMFVMISGASTWAAMRMMTQAQRTDRRRIRTALDTTTLEVATRSRIEAITTPPGSTIARALLQIGAVAGTQVRLWRLSEASGLALAELWSTCRQLAAMDLVRNSGVDAGDDRSRNLTELTPVGLRCLQEAQRR